MVVNTDREMSDRKESLPQIKTTKELFSSAFASDTMQRYNSAHFPLVAKPKKQIQSFNVMTSARVTEAD